MVNTRLGTTGLKLTNALTVIHYSPITTKSNSARFFADEIAYLACNGMITVFEFNNVWGRVWRLTSKGLKMLEAVK